MKLCPSTRPISRRAGAAAALFFATTAIGCGSPPVAGPAAPTSTGAAAPASTGAAAPTSAEATEPTPADLFAKADVVRGGQLYDTWWKVAGVLDAVEPTGSNADYAKTKGKKTGAVTFRCKECHGWDYKGRDGAYASGKSFTGVAGLLRAQAGASPDELYKVLRDGLGDGTHKGYAAHLSATDTWDLVKFIKEGITDLGPHIAADTKKPTKADVKEGQARYKTCAGCHGEDGKTDNFGSPDAPEYVGTVAANNPWEFIHKVRFGQPGTKMPSAIKAGWTPQEVLNVLGHAQTLPVK